MAFRTTFSRALSSASVRFFSTSTTCRNSPPCFRFISGPSLVQLAVRTGFFGNLEGLQFSVQQPKVSWIPSRQMGALAKIKRRKDAAFDKIIQREKKLKIVSKIKDILVKQPGKTMTLLSLGKHRRHIGLTGKRRVVALLNRFPAVFELYNEGHHMMCVRFTEEAEQVYEGEEKLKAELEGFLVEKIRKLLMMSVDKRLTMDKIAHLKKDLGLPDDWKTSIVPKYPQFFKEVEIVDGTALELTHWDPLLAVSAAQKKAATEHSDGNEDADFPAGPRIVIDGEEIKATAVSTKRLNLPKGLQLSKKDKVGALKFQQMPYQSPYEFSDLDPGSVEAEKRACAVVHELLSLTLEKKVLVDHLTHLKKDYRFSQRIRAMLIRHPEMFYVSFKGQRDSVFLRDAYRGSELIEKDPLCVAKERLADLVSVPRQQQKVRERDAVRADGSEVQEGEDDFDNDEDDEDYDSESGEESADDEEDEDSDDEEEGAADEGKQRRKADEKPPVPTSRPRPTVSSSRPRPVGVDEYLGNLSSRVRERW
ncbi:hypothetical protein R1flu_018485 [Riccia fluitans]|uniref:PORR domain-containing protein n=1 Tax=Riccia fluitans TaxID=41844 RepID=A0ABD1ZFY2_9MARC